MIGLDGKLNETPFIDLTSDFVFKKIFGEEPNKDLLISFLGEVFAGRKEILDLKNRICQNLIKSPYIYAKRYLKRYLTLRPIAS